MTNRGTHEGTEEEINFVKLLNKKEDLNLWKTLNLDSNNHYAIHVIYHKFGMINQKKVKPKAVYCKRFSATKYFKRQRILS